MSSKRIIVAALLLFGASGAQAATYLGSYSGNDPFPRNLVLEKLGIDTPALYKCDVAASALRCIDSYTDNSVDGAFRIAFDDSKSGQWGWSGAGLSPHYMTIKAGNGYALYDVSDDIGDEGGRGFWDISGREDKNLSHISFYNTGIGGEVPLPASALLLLAGLGGLVIARRRKS